MRTTGIRKTGAWANGRRAKGRTQGRKKKKKRTSKYIYLTNDIQRVDGGRPPFSRSSRGTRVMCGAGGYVVAMSQKTPGIATRVCVCVCVYVEGSYVICITKRRAGAFDVFLSVLYVY